MHEDVDSREAAVDLAKDGVYGSWLAQVTVHGERFNVMLFRDFPRDDRQRIRFAKCARGGRRRAMHHDIRAKAGQMSGDCPPQPPRRPCHPCHLPAQFSHTAHQDKREPRGERPSGRFQLLPGKEWLLHIGDADLATVQGDFAKLIQDGCRRGVDGGLETGHRKVEQRA